LLINRVWTDSPVQPGNRFSIVIEHIGPSVKNRVQSVLIAIEIRNQDLDLAFWCQRSDFSNRFGPMGRATIRQIVTINRGDYSMSQVKMGHGFGDVSRLQRIQGSGRSFSHGAKSAMPSADITAQHKGRGPIRPALKNVGAPRFLADGVQIQSFNQLKYVILISRVAESDFEPFRLRLTDFGGVTDYV